MPMLLVVAVWVFGPVPVRAQGDSEAIRQVLAAEDRRFAAMRAADTAVLGRYLELDLTYTHTDGEHDTRAELLSLLASGRLRYVRIEPSARSVRVLGNVAVVDGRAAMGVESGGQRVAFGIRYLAVYRRGARGWALLAWQSTRLPG